MKTLRTAFCSLFLFGLLVAPPAQAQTPWELGPLLGVNLDNDNLLLGAVARIHLPSAPITLNPGLELYPGIDDGSLFVVNFDVQYELEAASIDPYVGAGISWATRTSDTRDTNTDFGLNLKGGLLFSLMGSARPYVEAAVNIGGGGALIFRGGFLFTIG